VLKEIYFYNLLVRAGCPKDRRADRATLPRSISLGRKLEPYRVKVQAISQRATLGSF
jgi:hypothetical protein